MRGIHSKDLDYAVKRGRLRKVASRVSRGLNGKIVELKKERILRVVLNDGTNLDFGLLQGEIQNDLRCRDFTVNAMAWSPETGLLDPLGGTSDLKSGILRGISRKNFMEDPLRLLRAYRFFSESSLRIEKETRQILKDMHSDIKKSASERITLEFFKLINSERAPIALRMALRDGILSEIIPLSFNRLDRNIKLISKFNEKPEKMNERVWFKEFSQGLNMRGLIRLEGLIIGSDMEELLKLSFSRKIKRSLVIVSKLYDDFNEIDLKDRGNLFNALSDAGPASLDLMLLSGNESPVVEYGKFRSVLEKGVINADEIMKNTGLSPGARLGKAIKEVKRLQFEGKIRKKSDAIRWLKKEF